MTRAGKEPVLPDDAPGSTSSEDAHDRALVQAIRRGEAGAVEEFFRRFQPALFEAARALCIPRWSRREWVADTLTNAVQTLSAAGAIIPTRSLTAYLISWLRRDWVDARRAARRRWLIDCAAARESAIDAEGAVSSTCSTYSIRASGDPLASDPGRSRTLEHLIHTIGARLSEDDWTILNGVSACDPHDEIARRIGVTRAALTQRLYRARKRLRAAVLRRMTLLSEVEREELLGFLRRCDMIRDNQWPTPARGPSGGRPPVPDDAQPRPGDGRRRGGDTS